MRSNTLLSICAALAVGAGTLPLAAEPQAARTTARPATTSAERALEALRAFREAAVEWSREAETGEPLSPEMRAAFQEELEALRPIVQRLLVEPEGPSEPTAEQPPREVFAKSKRWVEAGLAIGPGSAATRAGALDEIRAAFGGSEVEQHAAMKALAGLGEVDYDKAAFRDLILPHVREASGAKQVTAFYALFNTAPREGDLQLVHGAWDRPTPELRDSIAHLCLLFGDHDLTGRSEEILLDLLASEDRMVRRSVLGGMWGARVGERLEARVIELSRDTNHSSAHDAIYYALATFDEKSPAVVERLIELLSADPENAGRALWGLSHGVPRGSWERVAEALVALHNARSNPRARADCARLVERYGGPEWTALLERR